MEKSGVRCKLIFRNDPWGAATLGELSCALWPSFPSLNYCPTLLAAGPDVLQGNRALLLLPFLLKVGLFHSSSEQQLGDRSSFTP